MTYRLGVLLFVIGVSAGGWWLLAKLTGRVMGW